MPPGSRALAFASRWFDQSNVHRVFEPLVADWQREWLSAPAARRWWVYLRGLFAFITTFLVSYAPMLRTPMPSWLVRRVLIRMGTFGAIVGVAYLARLWRFSGAELWSSEADGPLIAAAVMQGVTLATTFLPFAMGAGVDAIRGNELPPAVERAAVTKLVVITTIWMIIGAGWMVPAMEMRRASVGAAMAGTGVDQATPRGMRELSTYERVFHPEQASVPADQPAQWLRGREFARRVALILLPVALACLRWRQVACWPLERPPHWTVAVAGTAMILATFTLASRLTLFALLLSNFFAFVQPWRERRWQERAGGTV